MVFFLSFSFPSFFYYSYDYSIYLLTPSKKGFLSDRVAWAGTFLDILTEERREDALEVLPKVGEEGREEEERRVREQLKKKLNDHQEAQIMFYCLQNYGVERGERIGGEEGAEKCGDGLVTQKEGTEWLEREIKVFEERVIESARK